MTAFEIVLGTAFAIGTPLSWAYLNERAKSVAREITDKALQTHKHEYDMRLASIQAGHARELERAKAEHGRRGAEAGLYARERHRAYPRIYKRYRVAMDRMHNAMIAGAPESQPGKVELSVALATLTRAKNAEILDDLYLSDAVRDYLEHARQRIAKYSAEVSSRPRPGDLGSTDRVMGKFHRADRAVHELRSVMRDELRTATDAPRPTDQQWKEWAAEDNQP